MDFVVVVVVVVVAGLESVLVTRGDGCGRQR